jgi:dihydroorotase-like cyclic amidohydrolase
MSTQNRIENSSVSADANRVMQDLMDSMDALRALYSKENQALKKADTSAFFSLQQEKIELAQAYQRRMETALNRKDDLLLVHPDLKSLIRTKQEEFSKLAADNLTALGRMRRTAERMGQRIVEAARIAAQQDSVAYGANGGLTTNRNNPVTTGINESA